jgi:hypothetical protein
MAIARFPSIVIDCPDPGALATFYGAMLDWKADVSADWAEVRANYGQCISFQQVEAYTRLRAIHLTGLVQVSGSPRSIGAGPVRAGWVASCAGRRGPHPFGLGIGDDVAVAHRRMAHGEFQDAVEDHPAAAGAASVEPEHELV